MTTMMIMIPMGMKQKRIIERRMWIFGSLLRGAQRDRDDRRCVCVGGG